MLIWRFFIMTWGVCWTYTFLLLNWRMCCIDLLNWGGAELTGTYKVMKYKLWYFYSADKPISLGFFWFIYFIDCVQSYQLFKVISWFIFLKKLFPWNIVSIMVNCEMKNYYEAEILSFSPPSKYCDVYGTCLFGKGSSIPREKPSFTFKTVSNMMKLTILCHIIYVT